MVTFPNLRVGDDYTRHELAKLFNYKSHHALSRGIVTPADANFIILFGTHKNQKSLPNYSNYIQDDKYNMDGELNHSNDMRLLNSGNNNQTIHLFYRLKDHQPFTYYGIVTLESYNLNSSKGTPSKFIFTFNKMTVISESSLATDDRTSGIQDENLSATEGNARFTKHKYYERVTKKRMEAIKIHGNSCIICNFNFNNFYGADLAKNYIQIHHIIPISKGKRATNPQTDLVPVCANCHAMLHRSRTSLLTPNELKKFIDQKH